MTRRVLMGRWCFVFALICASLASSAEAATFSDDFNDGNASGWTTFNPLGVGTFSFPGGNTFRIQAGEAPGFPNFGPGRAGAFRTELNMAQFHISVDLVDWQENGNFFGIIARAKEIGAGTLDGYLLSYSPSWYTNEKHARFAIDRIEDEGDRTRLAEWRIDPIDPTHQYRMVFAGDGPFLTAWLYDLENLATPLFDPLEALDLTYMSGVPGLFVAGSVVNNITSDATFDNFIVNVPEPAGITLALIGTALVLYRTRRFSATNSPFRMHRA